MSYYVTIRRIIGFYVALGSEVFKALHAKYGYPDVEPEYCEMKPPRALEVVRVPGGMILSLRNSPAGIRLSSNNHGDKGDLAGCEEGCVFLSDSSNPAVEGELQRIIVELLLAGDGDIVDMIDPDDEAPHGDDHAPRTAYGGEYGLIMAG